MQDGANDEWEATAKQFGVEEEIFEAFFKIKVEIVDGYHRIGTVEIILRNPRALLHPELNIDWPALSQVYPSWIKVDRNKKVTFAATPDPR